MYFIIGRSGSGKDSLGKALEKKLDWKPVVSWTNRPIRETETNGVEHWFIDHEGKYYYNCLNKTVCRINPGAVHCSQVIAENVVAYTEINGYSYWATEDDLKEADYYIIDPKGLYEYDENHPEEDYGVIYVSGDCLLSLKGIDREKTALKSILTMYRRRRAEDTMFNEFDMIFSYWKHLPNKFIFHYWNNFMPFENQGGFDRLLEAIKERENKCR